MTAGLLEFSVTENDAVPDIAISSDDITCEVCGKALSYSGRGRKPKFCDEHKKSSSSSNGSSSRRSTRDVEAACAALSGAYSALAMPLMMVSPAAAREWAEQANALETRNRVFLEASPDLAKRIAAAAGKGGSTAFVLSHVIAIAPVLRILVSERRSAAEQEETVQEY